MFLFSRWERAVCRVKAIALSVEWLLRYANCSGSSEAGSTEQMCSLTSFSKHLLKMGVRATGLQSFKHVILHPVQWSPCSSTFPNFMKDYFIEGSVCVWGNESKQNTGVSNKNSASSHIWLKTKLRIDSEILRIDPESLERESRWIDFFLPPLIKSRHVKMPGFCDVKRNETKTFLNLMQTI